MCIIRRADGKIAKLWAEGKIQPVVYRLLSCVISAEVEGGLLLHNAVTGELVFLTTQEAGRLSGLPCRYAPWMDELIKKHFLVRAGSDDQKTVDGLRSALRMLTAAKTITGYTILPTTHCNARCFYCYEAGCKHETMRDETADRLVAFMEANRGGKEIRIRWFGGEPLLGIRQIDRICNALKEENIPFSSSMMSNAFLFNEEIAERAETVWNLKKIQITLDGTETIYNETKAYVTPCESPYKKVLDNIGLLMKNRIHVSIRLNLGMHNFDDLSTLVEELGRRFEDKTYLGAYTDILFEDCGFEPTHFHEDELHFLYTKKEALDDQIRRCASVDALEGLPKLTGRSCMTDDDSTVVVTPSGMLSKCEHFIDTNPVGKLETGITNLQEVKNDAERVVFPECSICPMYPACIKLKVCVRNFCSRELSQAKIKNVVRSMKRHYEVFAETGCIVPENGETI